MPKSREFPDTIGDPVTPKLRATLLASGWTPPLDNTLSPTLNAILLLVDVCHQPAKLAGWWHDLETGAPKDRNTGELLMLAVSELSEAMEGDRKGLKDDKLPQYPMFVVELVDALVRIFDIAGGKGMKEQLARAFVDKLAFNASRADHKIANRRLTGGKKY